MVVNVASQIHAKTSHTLTRHHSHNYSPQHEKHATTFSHLKPTNFINLNNNNNNKTNNNKKKRKTTTMSISNNNVNNNNNNDDDDVVGWEVLALLSDHLDPKTLATASCVSKSWLSSFSTEYIWDPLCKAHFPTLSALHGAAGVGVIPSRRLYGIGYAAARLRDRRPSKPNLSLDNLLFTVTIRVPHKGTTSGGCGGGGGHVINIVKPCKELKRDPHGTFRFEVDVEEEKEWGVDELEGVKVTWNVVDSEWRAVFGMAEESGVKKGGFAACSDGWFSEELPSPGCCSSGGLSSGLVADLRLEMTASTAAGEVKGGKGDRSISVISKKMKIEKVTLGVMCIVNWRYLSLEDALSYLDHFLPL